MWTFSHTFFHLHYFIDNFTPALWIRMKFCTLLAHIAVLYSCNFQLILSSSCRDIIQLLNFATASSIFTPQSDFHLKVWYMSTLYVGSLPMKFGANPCSSCKNRGVTRVLHTNFLVASKCTLFHTFTPITSKLGSLSHHTLCIYDLLWKQL